MYVREGFNEKIDEVRSLIFDFDGVLVQTRDSYRRNIIKVVDYYFLEILGLEGKPGILVDLTDVQRFKDTGLFNNDWNLTYALILYYLSALFRRLFEVDAEDELRAIRDLRFSNLETFIHKLSEIGDSIQREGINIEELVDSKGSNEFGIDSFLKSCKSGDPEHIQSIISVFFPEPQEENLELAVKMIPYSNDEEDLLKRLFEESYLGEELFQRFYGRKQFFGFKEGFMEKEDFIPKTRTLQILAEKTGKFSIYSERSRSQALYHLKKNQVLNYFDSECFIFNEDMAEREKTLKASGMKVTLGKPNPTLFIELVKKCVCKGYAAYIGDSVSDILTVINSRRRGLRNIYFFGVLSSSENKNQLANKYMELGADIITYDINELAEIFED